MLLYSVVLLCITVVAGQKNQIKPFTIDGEDVTKHTATAEITQHRMLIDNNINVYSYILQQSQLSIRVELNTRSMHYRSFDFRVSSLSPIIYSHATAAISLTRYGFAPVSYTHLTLPTILRV